VCSVQHRAAHSGQPCGPALSTLSKQDQNSRDDGWSVRAGRRHPAQRLHRLRAPERRANEPPPPTTEHLQWGAQGPACGAPAAPLLGQRLQGRAPGSSPMHVQKRPEQARAQREVQRAPACSARGRASATRRIFDPAGWPRTLTERKASRQAPAAPAAVTSGVAGGRLPVGAGDRWGRLGPDCGGLLKPQRA
jgi:hypothetical protein